MARFGKDVDGAAASLLNQWIDAGLLEKSQDTLLSDRCRNVLARHNGAIFGQCHLEAIASGNVISFGFRAVDTQNEFSAQN